MSSGFRLEERLQREEENQRHYSTMWGARSLREAMVLWDGTAHVITSQCGFLAGGERRFNIQLPAAIATMVG